MHKYAEKRFRQYETIVILTPSINQGMADTVTGRFRAMLDQFEGKLTRVSLWGLRRMAYRIKKHDKGIYYQINYVAPQGFVNEMEKYLRVSDHVIRYLTVQTSEIPVDPGSIIIKSSDIEFGNIEEAGDVSAAEAEEEAEEETPAGAGEEPQEIEEPVADGEETGEADEIAAKVEEAARQIDIDDFSDVEVDAGEAEEDDGSGEKT